MGQKVNPISLRLQYTNRHFDSSWYSQFFYKQLILKDLFLQKYLNNFLKLVEVSTGRYSIQHLQKQTQIFQFLNQSYATREWRTQNLGLQKNLKNLQRYFFSISENSKKNDAKNWNQIFSSERRIFC